MTDEARLQRWLASQHGAGMSGPAGHLDMQTLARHAAGQLSGPTARLVNDHLDICEDGRCAAYVSSRAGAATEPPSAPGPDGDRIRARTFQSRDAIWDAVAQMARAAGTPMDDVVCDAMLTYARARGHAPPASEAGSMSTAAGIGGVYAGPHIMEMPERPPRGQAVVDPYQPSRGAERFDDEYARTSNRGTFPRPAPGAMSDMGPDSRTTPRRGAVDVELPPSEPPPPPMRRPPGGPARTKSATTAAALPLAPPRETAKRLILLYQGRSHTVDKDRYMLGRSKAQADLRLDDPNVSRQHAVIERVGASWFLVDLGSTNGVHVGNERVARRALADGDVIHVISHQIRCTLR